MSAPSEETTDWPQQATEAIVGFVDNVKYKTTRPATMATRGVVYGIIIVALGIPALIMLLIGLVHLFSFVASEYLDLGVWIVYLVFGLLFTLAGLWQWRKRIA